MKSGASDDVQNEVQGLNMGAMDFIKKPFVPDIMIGRIGGDEFIAFYESDSNRENVACVANKIINQISSFEFSFKPLLKVSASIGMAVVSDDGCSFMDLYSKADKALYYVKQNGKQHYHFYSDESEESGSKLCVDADIDAIKKI